MLVSSTFWYYSDSAIFRVLYSKNGQIAVDDAIFPFPKVFIVFMSSDLYHQWPQAGFLLLDNTQLQSFHLNSYHSFFRWAVTFGESVINTFYHFNIRPKSENRPCSNSASFIHPLTECTSSKGTLRHTQSLEQLLKSSLPSITIGGFRWRTNESCNPIRWLSGPMGREKCEWLTDGEWVVRYRGSLHEQRR